MRSAGIRASRTNVRNAGSKDRDNVGKIFAVYDIMPESTDVPLDNVIEAFKKVVPKGVEINNTKIEPVAFGLKKIVGSFVIDDTVENVGNLLEDGLRSIPGVENIECTSSALL